MREWKFMAVIENEYPRGSEYRMFSSEIGARRFIESEHEKRWDDEKDEMKKDEEFEDAAVYAVTGNGKCRLLQRYTTVVDNHLARCQHGGAEGWIDPEERARIYGDDD